MKNLKFGKRKIIGNRDHKGNQNPDPRLLPHPHPHPISLLILMASLLGVVALYFVGGLDGQDYLVQDMWYLNERPVFTKVVVVAIDEESLEAVGRWPWDRRILGDLISRIGDGQPKSIGLDLLLTEASGDQQEDKSLNLALQALEKKGVRVVLACAAQFNQRSTRTGGTLRARQIDLPASTIMEGSGADVGHINVVPDGADGVVRMAESAIEVDGIPYSNFAMAMLGAHQEVQAQARSQSPFYIDFVGPTNTYGQISSSAVLSGAVNPAYFKDCYVLIGPTALGLLQDRYLTAIDRQVPMAGVEIHGNLLQAYLEGRFVYGAPLGVDLVAIFVMAGLGWLLGRWLKLTVGAFLVAASCLLYLVMGRWLYGVGLGTGIEAGIGIRVTLVYPLVAGGISFFAIHLMRYGLEIIEKKRIRQLFSKYVSPEVVNEIVKLDDATLLMASQRRDVSVLFVDIRGFTPLSEQVAPEIVVQVLNAYLSLTSNAVFSVGGTIDKYIGDATMALFNAPLDLENHPLCAVKAAIAMVAGQGQLQESLVERFGLRLSFGIGIHTGTAIIGNIGSANRLDYTAIGDTVNTAARLESRALRNEILVSEGVYKATQDWIEYDFVGPMKLKGKEEDLPVYRVVGLKEGVERNVE